MSVKKKWSKERIRKNRLKKNRLIAANYFVRFVFVCSVFIWPYVLFFSPTDIDELRFAFFSSQASYKEVVGFINKSEVVKFREPTYKGQSKGYKANLGYKYHVDGKDYYSGDLTFYDLGESPKFSTKKNAERFTSKYHKNKKVTIYYDINKPTFSMILKPEKRPSAFVLFLFFIALFLLSLVGFLYVKEQNNGDTHSKSGWFS